MKTTHYVAREPDAQGHIHYPDAEHAVWQTLVERQLKLLEGRACQEYLDGLDQLALPRERIPQLGEINRVLEATTGWQVERVPALIPFQRFFELLASKRFPVATFIRTPEELDYLQEPDIFHEIFGHCPLLTNPWFAEFTHTYGQLGLKASKEERVYLARLYWMTVEFGLVDTPAGLRIYGGGILSSCRISSSCSIWPSRTSWPWCARPCAWACTGRSFRRRRRRLDNAAGWSTRFARHRSAYRPGVLVEADAWKTLRGFPPYADLNPSGRNLAANPLAL